MVGSFLEKEEEALSDSARTEIDIIAQNIEESLNTVYEGRKRKGFAVETDYRDDAEIAVHQRGYEDPFCRVGLTTRNGPIEAEYIDTDPEHYEADFPPVDESVGAVRDTLLIESSIRQRSIEDLPETYIPKQG